MPSYRTKVGPNGQIALPAELAERIGAREGAEVEFYLTLEGDVFFHAITGVAAGWKGLFPTEVRNPPISIREMDEALLDAAAEDDERIRREARSDLQAGAKGRPAAE